MNINLKTELPPGDCLTLTAAIYSLHKQFPNLYKTSVETKHNEVFKNNPNISKKDETYVDIEANYPSVHRCNQVSSCFINGYTEDLATQLEIPLKLQTNRPHLYLTDEEKNKYQDEKPYWVIISGGKSDFTCKHLPQDYLQQVVNNQIHKTKFIQPIRSTDINYPLENVKRLLNISLRETFSCIYNCEGCIGPVTLWQHIAAAFEKPYICVAGGREPATWIQYPNQHTLHTIGTMDCCKEACWKSRVMPLMNDKHDKSLCENPIFYEQQWVPKCLLKITPNQITNTMEMICN